MDYREILQGQEDAGPVARPNAAAANRSGGV
jgi:hypothetical protein